MSLLTGSETVLPPISPVDCFLLAPVFRSQCARLFPVPVRVEMESLAMETILTDQETAGGAPAEETGGSTAPVVKEAVLELAIPATPASGTGIRFRLHAADPVLLKRFSRTWLVEFQERLEKQLQLVRLAYVDPETGFYNRRAMSLFLQERREGVLSLFLISLAPVRRGYRSDRRRYGRLLDLIEALSRGILFTLGQGVVALLSGPMQARQRMRWLRRLQARLRREGIPRIQAASAPLPPGLSGGGEEIVRALDIAERRGPYGLCDTECLEEHHPFALPREATLKALKRLWRGPDRFALAWFRSGGKHGDDLPAALASLEQGETVVAEDKHSAFVFAPGRNGQFMLTRAKEMARRLERDRGMVVSVGVAWFPCLRHTRPQVVRNCAKALLHAGFYEPGAVVLFDHLSLNVSGDWFFDQGDYRQAVREYSDGLLLRPGDENLLNSLGVALMEMRQYRRALEAFRRVLDRDPDNYMALVNLAYGSQFLGRDQEAVENYEKALAVRYHGGGRGDEIYPQLARLYCRKKEYGKALRVLDLWSRERDSEREYLFHRLMGEACLETGRPEQAMRALQRSLRLYPQDPDSLSMLGLLYVLEGEGVDTGLALLEKSLAYDESRFASWVRLARALLHVGRAEQALEAIRAGRRLNRKDDGARILQARILFACGRPGQARQILHPLSGPWLDQDEELKKIMAHESSPARGGKRAER